MAYTTAQINAALVAPNRQWDFRYEFVTRAGDLVAEAKVASCTVSNNDLATEVKRTCRASLQALPTGVSIYTDRFRPYARLRMPDGGWHEWLMGTFLLTSTPTRWNNNAKGSLDVEGYDDLLVLKEDGFLTRYVAAKNAVVTTSVISILAAAGFPTNQIVASTKTLPAAMEWDPGTSKLRVINEMLSAIDYGSLTMDAYGAPVASPYVSPSDAAVVWTYRVDADSVMRPNIDVELDLWSVPNAWIMFVSEPDRPTLVAKLVNDSPTSILSTVSRGRTIVQVLTNETPSVTSTPDTATGGAAGKGKGRGSTDSGKVLAVDQAVLDAKLARAAEEASQLYETASFSTGLMPFHGSGDVAVLEYGAGSLRYKSHEWSVDLVAGGTMQHKFRRVVKL